MRLSCRAVGVCGDVHRDGELADGQQQLWRLRDRVPRRDALRGGCVCVPGGDEQLRGDVHGDRDGWQQLRRVRGGVSDGKRLHGGTLCMRGRGADVVREHVRGDADRPKQLRWLRGGMPGGRDMHRGSVRVPGRTHGVWNGQRGGVSGHADRLGQLRRVRGDVCRGTDLHGGCMRDGAPVERHAGGCDHVGYHGAVGDHDGIAGGCAWRHHGADGMLAGVHGHGG